MKDKRKNNIKKIIFPLILLIAVTLLAKSTGLLNGFDGMVIVNLGKLLEIIIAVAFDVRTRKK